MKNVNIDVINYLESIGCGKFGTDLFLNRVPSSLKNTPVALWWLVPSTTNVMQHNTTGEDTIRFQYELYYRSDSMQDLNEELFRASREIVGSHCYELNNFQTMDVTYVSTNQMTRIDDEERVYGNIVFTVTVYNILETTQ